MSDKPWFPHAPCCIKDNECCACGHEERYLRAVIGRDGYKLSPEQRDWCLSEIGQVEGYERAEHESDNDRDLARNVLSAWTDFARDKGLL